MKLVVHYCDDNNFVPVVVECASFTIDKSGNFEPLVRFFDVEENEIQSISLTSGDFHVCCLEK